MKKIGFVDYFISEWHANNYPAWIEKASEELGLDYKVCYAWAEDDVSHVDGVTTDEWCAKFGVERCSTIEELCEKSDFIVILAPSHTEKHLPYAKIVLKYGKRTYIDKTFAPNLKEAKEMFELGEKYGTPIFTTSALRYATELDDIKDPKFLNVWGGGGNFPEYSIHQIEMVIKLMNVGHKSVNVSKTEKGCVCDIVMEDGRKVQLNYAPDFAFAIESENGKVNIASSFFDFLIVDILKFFETGAVSFDKEQTLMAMDLREKIVEQL
jgi:hypothetical protein